MGLRIRVGICDDHAIVRAGFRRFLADHADIEVTAEAASGPEALDVARRQCCDLLLLDLSMPGQSGVDTLRAIRVGQPGLPVLILSSYPEEHYAPSLLRLGASGYVRKDCEPGELVRAIRLAASGRRYVNEALGERLAPGVARRHGAPAHERLSERELQVFLRLAVGESVTGIGRALDLSVKTVSTYRSRILEKLSLGSNSELTYYALKNGLIQ